MSRTNEEELGRRRFQLVKEQAVEDAVEKIRRAPAVGWESLSTTDYTLLREVLADLWVNLERERWEQYSFSTLSRQDILDILSLAKDTGGRAISQTTLGKMDAILSHARENPPRT